jgi:hypothetical protein
LIDSQLRIVDEGSTENPDSRVNNKDPKECRRSHNQGKWERMVDQFALMRFQTMKKENSRQGGVWY